MAAAALKGPFNGEYHVNDRMESKPSTKKRVFVQTETGCVLGMELDRSDNAQTVKRKLQLALNIPTEERSLINGDTVFKNDLSCVRNHSPLLLTKNLPHRSSSTPCLSLTGCETQQMDQSGPIEILGCSNYFGETNQLVKQIVEAMEIGVDPVSVRSGLGGAYYFRNREAENVAIVKPTDEEPYAPNNPKGFVGRALGQPGLKRSVRVGETGFREVAAYLLDYDHFANVPSTALVKITHSIFNINDGVNRNKNHEKEQVSKIASLQQYIPHDFDASDYGTSGFPVFAVHRIGILDCRILNTDRHAGNLLVRKVDGFGQVELFPIDHGLCLPEDLEDPYFEWIHWAQASVPFSEDELDYIDNLDPFRDSDMLRMELPMIREACLRVLILCTFFLKEAAGFGLCLAEIGEMMSREFRGHGEEPSELELLCIEAKRLLEKEKMILNEVKSRDNKDFQFETDRRSPRCKLLESVDEDLESTENEYSRQASNEVVTVSKLSMLLRSMDVGEKSWQHEGPMKKTGLWVGTSSGNRSVNEQLPASSSFMKLSQINEEEWALYLEIFRKLLHPAFSNRAVGNIGQRQRQRLGTSCRF